MRLSIIAFAFGIFCLQRQAVLPPESSWLLLGAGAALFALSAARRRVKAKTANAVLLASILAAAFLAGFGWAAWRAETLLQRALPAAWEGQNLRATGVVAAMPQPFAGGTRFVFALERLEDERGNALPTAELPPKVALSWYGGWHEGVFQAPPPLSAGERWRFTVRLQRPHGNANPHGFDYEAWLLERGIRATGHVRARGVTMNAAPEAETREEAEPVALASAASAASALRLDGFVADSIHAPAYAIERLREAVRARFAAALPDARYAGILTALAVGDQNAIPAEQWELFARTGITHLMAISGLHVTMVAALIGGLASRLWRTRERLLLALPARRAAVLAGWLAAFAYALLAGFAVPAQRTLYMLSIVACALWLGQTGKPSRTLCLALLLVLLYDPWAVLAPGFWLSFGAVAALFHVGVARLEIRRSVEVADAVEEAVVEAAGSRIANVRHAVFRSIGGFISGWGLTQWAATLGTLPLLLIFFHQFSLVSPLANAVAIPAISFVITPLALAAAILPQPLSAALLALDHALLSWLMRLIEALAAWPVWRQASPPWWSVPPAILGLVWFLLPRGVPGRWAGAALLLPALSWPAPRPPAGPAWLTVLDVGQGLAVAVRTAEHTLLYDTGPRYGLETDAGSRVVVPWLYAEGIDHLDRLIVTHADSDHSGGVASVLAAMPVHEIYSSLDDAIGERCRAGQQWEWDGVRFSILYPEHYPERPAANVPEVAAPEARQKRNAGKNADRPNHRSCVLRVENAAGSVLLTSDIEARDEARLLKGNPAVLHADVLLAPHHGSRTSSTSAFVAAVGAHDVVFPVGYRNRYRHPHPAVVARYAGSRQWRSDEDGAISVMLGDGIEIDAWRRQEPRYWHGR